MSYKGWNLLALVPTGPSGSSSDPVHLHAPHHVTVQDAFYDCSQPTRKIGYLLTCRRADRIAAGPARRRPIFILERPTFFS
jgi:hypothetical protein